MAPHNTPPRKKSSRRKKGDSESASGSGRNGNGLGFFARLGQEILARSAVELGKIALEEIFGPMDFEIDHEGDDDLDDSDPDDGEGRR